MNFILKGPAVIQGIIFWGKDFIGVVLNYSDGKFLVLKFPVDQGEGLVWGCVGSIIDLLETCRKYRIQDKEIFQRFRERLVILWLVSTNADSCIANTPIVQVFIERTFDELDIVWDKLESTNFFR